MEGTTTRAWQTFTAELNKQGVEFAAVVHADETLRQQVIATIPNLSVLDRAVVSSTWAKLSAVPASVAPSATSFGSGPGMMSAHSGYAPSSAVAAVLPSSSMSESPLAASRRSMSMMHLNAAAPVAPPGPPSSSAIDGSGTMGGGGASLPSAIGVAGGGSLMLNSLAAQGGSGGGGAGGASSLLQPTGGFQLGSGPASYLGSPTRTILTGDPVALRQALARADSTLALPIASDLLQSDPFTLAAVLHDFLPQLGLDQIKTMLGIGGGGSGGGGAGGLFSDDIGNNGSGNGAALLDAMTPAINGQPTTPGHVLTAQHLSAQYGPGFTVTCNGQFLSLPYCIQPGDRIIARQMSDRFQ